MFKKGLTQVNQMERILLKQVHDNEVEIQRKGVFNGWIEVSESRNSSQDCRGERDGRIQVGEDTIFKR